MRCARRPLLQLLLQQGQYAAGGGRLFHFSGGIEHLHLAALLHVLHADLELRILRHRVVAPECEPTESAALLGAVGIRIDVAHVVQTLRAVAILDRETDAVQRQADPAPGAIERFLHGQRFAPVAESARSLWELLRTASSVELERVVLEGTGPMRRVTVDVTVDGIEGAALGVMSQGELHAMALSLFLPRATLPESPFRFVVIDDPVQSMDPARVDGLARVLAEVARSRQVVVFTHDDRLRESVRRLGIDARVIEVTRREGSVVELRAGLDPIARNLDDADAIARTPELPALVARQTVPGFCRAAIEAASIEVIRRRRIGAGKEL